MPNQAIQVEWRDEEVRRALEELINTARNPGPALREIGELLTESTKQRFGSKTGPDGTRWEANRAATIARKGGNDPLVELGTLSSQIHYELRGKTGVAIGSSLKYAAMQQFGGTKSEFPHIWGDIPARPFLGLSERDRDNVLKVIGRALANAVR